MKEGPSLQTVEIKSQHTKAISEEIINLNSPVSINEIQFVV